MGSVCCCLRVEDLEEYVNPNSSVYRHCVCFNCFIQQVLYVYAALFHREEVNALPSSIPGETSLATSGVVAAPLDNSLSETYLSPPRPLPYDADPRCSHVQRDGLFSRREKGSSHFHEESVPLRRNSDADVEPLGMADKKTISDYDGGSKLYLSESSMKCQSMKFTSGEPYILTSSEDEDVCPTCLEEYTPENPKIMTQCSHHFHLGCIYEWMERSESCPVCGKVMVFEETT